MDNFLVCLGEELGFCTLWTDREDLILAGLVDFGFILPLEGEELVAWVMAIDFVART